jgi:hypothetical protein
MWLFLLKDCFRFKDMSKGEHPAPFEVPIKEEDIGLLKWKPKYAAKKAAKELMEFENKLLQDTGKLSRKEKKKLKGRPLEDNAEEEAEEETQEKVADTPKQQPKKKSASPKVLKLKCSGEGNL